MRTRLIAAVLSLLSVPGLSGCATTPWMTAQLQRPISWPRLPRPDIATRLRAPELVRPAPFHVPFARRPVTPNPLVVTNSDFETIWRATIAIVDDYFDISSENRLSRRIVTDPKIGATIFEPWHGDSVGFRERLESSLQTIHRFAIVTVNDAPGGGFAVKVEVRKELEDLVKPERQAGGRAVYANDFPVNRTREIVGPLPLPKGWIPRGRDTKLEQAILERIRRELFLP